MKKSIIIMIALMIVISSSAVFAICPDPTVPDNKNNPGCPDFELTADNVKDVPNDKVAALPANKLTPEVLGAMKDEQIQALSTAQLSDHSVARNIPSDKLIMLTSSQLSNENVLLVLSGAPGDSRLKDLNPKEFESAFNTVYPASNNVVMEEAKGLSGVSIEQLTGGRKFIVDSNGNKFDISGEGSIYIDEKGVVHALGAGSRIQVVTKNKEYALIGTGTADKDGKFSCSKNEYCSVEGNDVLINVGGREKPVHINGKISVDINGNIVELKGDISDDYSEDPLVLGDKNKEHYSVNADKGTKVDWSQASSDPLKMTFAGEGSGTLSYYEGLNKKSSITGTSGATAEMRETKYASLKDCSLATPSFFCSYENYNKGSMNGFDLPEGGHIYMETSKRGSFTFGSGIMQMNGQDTGLAVKDSSGSTLMGAGNIDSGSTKVVLGDYAITYADKEGSNIVTFKSTKEAEFYTKDSSRVGIRMLNPEGTSQTQVITDAAGVKGTMSLKEDKAGASYPDVAISEYKSTPGRENNEFETLATVKVNEDSVSVVRGENGFVDLMADRTNNNDQKYVISISNLGDEKKGEVLYSNGQDSVLLGFDNGKYDLKSMENGFGMSLNDDEKDKVMKVLSDMGLDNKYIADIQRFGKDLFTSKEKMEIFASAKETITVSAEETRKMAEAAAETAAKTKEDIITDAVKEKIESLASAELKTEEAAAATVPPKGKLFSDDDKKYLKNVKPGSVSGSYYQDDNGVKAMLKDLGYDGPDAVTRFQAEAGIKTDGYVGVQTSSALLIACQNTGKCNDNNNLDTFRSKVLTPVLNAAIAATTNSGDAKVIVATPASVSRGDGGSSRAPSDTGTTSRTAAGTGTTSTRDAGAPSAATKEPAQLECRETSTGSVCNRPGEISPDRIGQSSVRYTVVGAAASGTIPKTPMPYRNVIKKGDVIYICQSPDINKQKPHCTSCNKHEQSCA